MPISAVSGLAHLAAAAPLALLAALAILAAAYQTKRLSVLQDELYRLAVASTAGADARAPNFGQLAVALTRADAFDLRCALEIQEKEPGERIGTLLVRQGSMDRSDVVRLLRLQDELRCGKRPNLATTRALAAYAVKAQPRKHG